VLDWINDAGGFASGRAQEGIEEPDEGNLIGKAKPVMRAPTLAELHEIFLG
jgi:hypothetical protein